MTEGRVAPRTVFAVAFVVVVGLFGAALASFNFAAGLGFVAGEFTMIAGAGCWYGIVREERSGKL